VFSLMNVALGLSARSQTRTVFSRDVISDRRQLTLYGGTLIAIVLATELDVLNRILDTTALTGGQWLVCLLLAGVLIVVEEVTKLILRRRAPA
jgi:Ca2+-transporting ATPase